jgi:Right handed beta helix region
MKRFLLAALALLLLPVIAFAQPGAPPAISQLQANPAAGRVALGLSPSGVQCNGATLTDVTTTASSAIVSSASYTFVPADVGKSITVGAGGNLATTGSPVIGTIALGVASVTGVVVGDYVYGPGTISPNTRVMAIAGNTLTLTQPASANGSAVGITIAHILNTTIASVSGGQASLAATPATSISGTAQVTFGSNDYPGIAAAVSAASAAGGGAVNLPRGMCVIAQSIYVPTKVSVLGMGAGETAIKWISPTDQQTPVFYNNNSYSHSTCTQAVAQAQSSYNRFSGFEIDDAAATLTTGQYYVQAKGVSFPCSFNVTIDHLYVHDTPATGIATDFGYRSLVTSNVVENAGRLGTTQYGSNGIGQGTVDAGGDSYVIADNIIINPAHYGAYVESQAAGVTTNSVVSITGNTVLAGPNTSDAVTGAAGIGAGIGNSGSAGAVITGNHIVGFGGYTGSNQWMGISVDSGTLNTGAGAATVIAGNTVENTFEGIQIFYLNAPPATGVTARSVISGNVVTGAQDFGIRVVPFASGSQLDAISITGNTVSGSSSGGIGVVGSGTASNITIADNVLNNNGATVVTAYRQAGIAIGASTTGLNIHNNRAYDNGTGTQKYGLGINAGVTITGNIQGNDFTGNATAAVLNSGTLTAWVSGNKGYNPLGAAAVTPAASPWTYTAGNTPEVLYLTGGTVSAVAKNSITLAAATPATVTLDPGETVTVTYSVVPTANTDRK